MMFIDLRSDTVTKPSPEMKQFMLQAELGDDVYGDDPTVNMLEATVAAYFGFESAVFCASGTMTNQIAIKTHTIPGDEVICDITSHVYNYEGGGIAFNSGVQVRPVMGTAGKITAEQMEAQIQPAIINLPRTSLVVLENTLNSFYVAGGSTVLGLLLALPAAYAISWHRMTWPATLTLFARMAPGTLFLLPWFIMFSNVGLSGTHAALIITHAVITLPIALWTMLPHFDGLPRELTESAQIDGCSSLKILTLIALPIVMPGLIVAIILSFIFSWNYFYFTILIIENKIRSTCFA